MKLGGLLGVALACLLVVQLFRHGEAKALGCYSKSKVRMEVARGVQPTITACRAHCAKNKWAVYGLACQTSCVCGGEVPPASALAKGDSTCKKKLAAAKCSSVNMYYITAVSTCKLQPLALNTNNLQFPDGTSKVTFNGGTMRFDLQGVNGVRALAGPWHTYGLYTFQVKMCDTPGPVGAVYTVSTTQVPPTNHDEVDLEFINAGQLVGETKGAIWTNIHKNGKEVLGKPLLPSFIQPKIKQRGFQTYNGFATYTIDWQPSYVRWYVNGKLLDERTDYNIPSKASMLVFTLWSWNDGYNCRWFGGCIDGGTKGFAEFRDVRRVLC